MIGNSPTKSFTTLVDKAAKYGEQSLNQVSQDIGLANLKKDMINALNHIVSGANDAQKYGGSTQIVSAIQNYISTSISNPGHDPNGPPLITITADGKKLIANFPTGFDFDLLEPVPAPFMLAWLLEKLFSLGGTSTNSPYPDLTKFQLLNNYYFQVCAYRAAKSEFISIDQERVIASTVVSAKNASKMARDAAKNANETVNKINKSANDSINKIQNNTETLVTRLETAVARAEEFTDYKQLDGYFASKNTKHKIGYYFFLVLFLACLSVMALIIIFDVGELRESLPIFSQGKYEIGKLLVIIAPTIIFVWVMRVFIRLAMLNIQLAEDAHNKTVLLRTMAALLDKKPGMTSEERIVAYNAIFRSSMSEKSNIDVAMPTIGDLGGLLKR